MSNYRRLKVSGGTYFIFITIVIELTQIELGKCMEQNNLTTSDVHLPYNQKLVPRAKELRKNMTAAEKKLWHNFLHNFPLRILRQRPIDNFIVDFYCAKLKLVIEVDGDSHFTNEGMKKDIRRTEILQGYGLRVIRFTNDEILHNFEAVCEKIESFLVLSQVEIPLSPP
jgi:very-short-patch-repair endonuclease